MAKLYCTGYFTGIVLRLPIDSQKPRNFHHEQFAIYGNGYWYGSPMRLYEFVWSVGSPWQPGSGDRVCSDHFISKRKSDLPSSPDLYHQSIKDLNIPGCPTHNEDSYRRLECAKTRARLRE